MRNTKLLALYQAAPSRQEAKEAPVRVLPPPPTPEERLWEPTTIGRIEKALWEDLPDSFSLEISAKDRMEHGLLLGKTGQGKSNLMHSMIYQDILAGRGFCLIDPHGKLIDDVARTIPWYRQDDVVYLDASDDAWPWGLNFFASPRGLGPKARAMMADQIVQLFRKSWDGPWANTTGELLRVIAETFLANRAGTMAMIPKLLTEAEYREAFLPRVRNPFVLTTWKRLTNARTGELKGEDIAPTLRRLNKFLMNPVVTNIVGQERTTLDFPAWMAGNKIVLIRLPDEGYDGIGREAVELLGTAILQLILRSAFTREVGSPLWAVYCDEFQHYVTDDLVKIIMNIRKYGVGMLLATQSFSNIKDEAIREGVLGVGTLICYQLTDADARIVAGEFRAGLRLDEDWQEKIVKENRGGYVYEWTVREYHRPTKTEVASRLASLRTLTDIGHCLVKTNAGEFHVVAPDMAEKERRQIAAWEADGEYRYRQAKWGAIVRRSRAMYCRSRFEVEREIRAELMPDGNDDPGAMYFDELPPEG